MVEGAKERFLELSGETKVITRSVKAEIGCSRSEYIVQERYLELV